MAIASKQQTAIGELPPGWIIRTISELATKVGSGATPLGGRSVYLQDRVSHALIRSQHVFDRYFDSDKLAYITEEHSRGLRNAEVRPGDILLNITGDGVTFARACLVPVNVLPACVNQHVSIIRVNRELCEPGYLVSFLTHPLAKRYMESFNTGGSRRALTKAHIESFEIPLPSLPIQRRIAGILSAYDDLIENSQRRIKILEAMARALYREWFVHFRFPGHESVPLEPSPLGEIPEGWEVKKLFALTSVNYGKNLPTKKLAKDGAYPVYGAAKIIGNYNQFTRTQRTMICGCRGSVGEMQITQPQCFVTNNSFTFDPTHPDNFFWLFHALNDRGLRDVVGGAAQPQITLEGISSVELVTPPLPLRTRFQHTVTPLFQQGWVLDSLIQKLLSTRDLLLPRLLSGQIEVQALPELSAECQNSCSD
jgi:Restriction endonuclease S subunits